MTCVETANEARRSRSNAVCNQCSLGRDGIGYRLQSRTGQEGRVAFNGKLQKELLVEVDSRKGLHRSDRNVEQTAVGADVLRFLEDEVADRRCVVQSQDDTVGAVRNRRTGGLRQ